MAAWHNCDSAAVWHTHKNWSEQNLVAVTRKKSCTSAGEKMISNRINIKFSQKAVEAMKKQSSSEKISTRCRVALMWVAELKVWANHIFFCTGSQCGGRIYHSNAVSPYVAAANRITAPHAYCVLCAPTTNIIIGRAIICRCWWRSSFAKRCRPAASSRWGWRSLHNNNKQQTRSHSSVPGSSIRFAYSRKWLPSPWQT